MIALALAALRARRGRALLAGTGVFAATLVLAVALVVGYGLDSGFERAAERADLPDVTARFDAEERADIDRRVRALPNLQAVAYRVEVTDIGLAAGEHSTDRGVAQVVEAHGRRGYAILDGRDVRPGADEVVIEQGLADAWGLSVGDTLDVGSLGPLPIVGTALAPDNVAFPLAPTARVYLERAMVERAYGAEPRVNMALLWANAPDDVDVLLTQARAQSFGVSGLRFITRAGVRVLLDDAAGIVIALMIAFALVAAGVAGLLLGQGAQAEVRRRLPAIGVQRALGLTPARVTALYATEAALVALPAGALGLGLGGLIATGPAEALLRALNELEPSPGTTVGLLAAALAATVALVTAAAAWPAWRAARRPPAAVLRGGELAAPRRRRGGGSVAGGRAAPLLLGARFAAARRARFGGLVAVLGAAAATVLLLLGLSSLLVKLRDDPGTVGKRFQLTVQLPRWRADAVRAIPGVLDAAPRYQVTAASSFSLGTPIRLIGYRGDHTVFEAPPLAAGRRYRADDEAEIGAGLADALGLKPGGRLAVQLPGGGEVAFKVVGIVRALDADGQIAYVPARQLIDQPGRLHPALVVRLRPGADRGAVSAALARLGAPPQRVRGATTRDGRFLGILAALLRVLAGTVALVCLYALAQALALLARERRPALALLRATGAGPPVIALVLAGAALAAVVPAALLAVALERALLGPLVTDLAAGYADLPLRPGAGQIALVAGGLALLAAGAAAWTARQAAREPVIAALRSE